MHSCQLTIPLLFVVLAASLAPAATLRTLSGKEYTGQITLDPPGKLVVATSAGTTSIDLNDLAFARFRSPEDAAPPAEPWTGKNIGKTRIFGAFRADGQKLEVRGCGDDIGINHDQFFFVFQNFEGNGQIVARVAAIEGGDPQAKAAVMFRASLDASSPFYSVHVHQKQGPDIMWRDRGGAIAVEEQGGAGGAPAWMKIVRSDDNFSASISTDGKDWKVIGEQQFVMPAKLLVGLAVCSRNPAAAANVVFDHAMVIGPSVKAASAAPGSTGVSLRNGSFLAGKILSVDAATVRLQLPAAQPLELPRSVVRFVQFAKPRAEARIPRDRVGLMFTTGDFLEGSIKELSDDRVSLDSILQGMRRLNTDQLIAAVLNSGEPRPARFEARAADGSIIRGDAIRFEKDAIMIDAKPAGLFRIALADLLELRHTPMPSTRP